jgi:hypothetical protein
MFHNRARFSGFTFVCLSPVTAATNLPDAPVPVPVPVVAPCRAVRVPTLTVHEYNADSSRVSSAGEIAPSTQSVSENGSRIDRTVEYTLTVPCGIA